MTWNRSNYSSTPASNSAINGVNIAEGCNASGINDAIRQLMADLSNGSVAASGWVMLVGGLILQWGHDTTITTTTTVTLPVTFSNNFFAVVATPDSGAAQYVAVTINSTSQFTIYKSNTNFTYWFALGN